MLRPAIGFAVVIWASLVAGCATDGEWSFRKFIGWDDPKTPAGPKLPRAMFETSERVENLGHKILGMNTFPGIEPMFFTIGIQETAIFHRGASELFISEGLVNRCKTEAELAAVLCSELGQMAAEKKRQRRLGGDRDTIPEVAVAGGSSMGGGTPDDPGRRAELAIQDRRPKAAPATDPIDAGNLARDLLRGAGYDTAELDRIQPLLKQSDRGNALRKQMSGSAAPPKWE